MYANLEEKTQTSRSSIDTPFHKPLGKLACMQVWPKTSVAWPTTTSSMVLKLKMKVRKGSTRYIGTECPFSTFFAPPKSFLCRLDQTKSVQSVPAPQQTFFPGFETLKTQLGIGKHKNVKKRTPCTNVSYLKEKTQTSGSSIDTPFHKPKGKLACMQVWPKTSVAWPTTTSSMVLKCQMKVRKGSKRYIGTECPFSTFFAPPKSFLCRLDQTKSLQSIPMPQQTFLPGFETLITQIGLKTHKNVKNEPPVPMMRIWKRKHRPVGHLSTHRSTNRWGSLPACGSGPRLQ